MAVPVTVPGPVFIDLDRSGQWFVIQSPYSHDFVEELKVRVPARNRRWRSEVSAWCVTRDQWAIAEKILRKYYDREKFQIGPAAEAAQMELLVEEVAEPSAMEYMKLGIRADAPDCVVHAAYLAISTTLLHVSSADAGQMGIYPASETRDAYEAICAMRDIAPQAALLPDPLTPRGPVIYPNADDEWSQRDPEEEDEDGYERFDKDDEETREPWR